MNKIKFGIKLLITTICASLFLSNAAAQDKKETIEPILYGTMDNWIVREIKESAIIGGNVKYIYEIGVGDSIHNNLPYRNPASPWGMSSVMAIVKGVTKASVTVFPERRGRGYCARLETRIENVKVLGLIDINVLASGTIFLGEMVEPITDTDNPMSKLSVGIPFTKQPSHLQFDYRVITGGESIRSTGFSRQITVNRKDMAEVTLVLQKRWEDSEGNIYAKRVGTAIEHFSKTVNIWQNGYRIPIIYGDITSKPFFKPYMGLIAGENAQYTRNSHGKMVPINEMGWAGKDETPTHIYVQFSSSNGGAYIGSVDSRLWVDNVALVY